MRDRRSRISLRSSGLRTNAEAELVRSSGGVFDIFVNGQLKFSKQALGRFPTDAEVDALANG